jgi:ribosomal protein S18 acetylase RimI-like enzyme
MLRSPEEMGDVERSGALAVGVRWAGPDDLSKLVEIYLSGYRGLERYAYRSPSDVEDYLSWAYHEEPEGFFVAELAGEPVGFVSVHTWGKGSKRRGEVVELAVMGRVQGRGLGRILMTRAEEYAHAKGCRTLSLWVGEGNVKAIQFYKRLGYSERSRFERWIKMVKDCRAQGA